MKCRDSAPESAEVGLDLGAQSAFGHRGHEEEEDEQDADEPRLAGPVHGVSSSPAR